MASKNITGLLTDPLAGAELVPVPAAGHVPRGEAAGQ